MDTKDVKYFDDKFGKLHGRVDELVKVVGKTVTQVAVVKNEVEHTQADLSCHIKKPCKNVGDHYDGEHKPRLGRILWVIAAIVGIVGTTAGVVVLFL